MPCEIRDNKIICSRGVRPAANKTKCKWCGKASTKLCDYPVTRNQTCDAPMCNEHAKKQGQNIDTCPDHPQMRHF